MSRHVFVAARADLADAHPGSALHLTGSEAHHAAVVRRLRRGEEVEVADGAGRRVVATVQLIERDRVDLLATEVRDEPDPQPRLHVVQALAKGERAELAVELLTEFGVDDITPWAAQRCIAVWRGDRAGKGAQRWRSTAREAGKQARRARFPVVHDLASTATVLALAGAADLALVLHESAEEPLTACTLPRGGTVLVVVGPEGGLTEGETDALTAAGARAVRLGPSVLRTSSAGAAAAAVIFAATGRWA